MKSKRLGFVALASLLALGSLQAAIADGSAVYPPDQIARGEAGVPLNDPAPEQRKQRPGRTRAQVTAELKEAQRTGDIMVGGEAGMTEYELNPSAYPERQRDNPRFAKRGSQHKVAGQ
jgi:hypothetical protein